MDGDRSRDCCRCVPHKTLTGLPRSGLILTVTRIREQPIIATRRVSWPPQITANEMTAGMEGIPRRYGVYQLFERVRDREEVMVWAYFGRNQPTAAQIEAANARLRTARFP
jgi:hypothetical protein